MWKIMTAVALLCLSYQPSSARNYSKVVCENEPDPARCRQIEDWYKHALTNDGGSCCGLGDAYWADKIEKVTDKGVFLTITDKRDCTAAQQPRYEENEEGDLQELPYSAPDDCIPGRIDMDGRRLFVQSKDIDHYKIACSAEDTERKCPQGNPTGHTVVFIQAKGQTWYDGGDIDGQRTMWPTVLCFFPEFDN